MKIIDGMKFVDENGFDISDDIFDFTVYFECEQTLQKCDTDDYDRLMHYFGNHIEMTGYRKNWYSPCKITEFIDTHRKSFDKFMNEENALEFRPSRYEPIEIEDEAFYDLYLNTFSSLLNGNYVDEDYTKLLKYLEEEENE